ncbi:MAG: hypothetical protein HYV97_04005 [Bdellovibrio sp.]|nr:hypothetical protein [Bdellovibrio sp.]
MISKNKNCNLVQESIAWGRVIDLEDKKHILNCNKCSAVASQIEELDSLMKNESIDIPSDFVDRIMLKIEKQEKNSASFLSSNWAETLMPIFDNTIFRWGISGIGFLFAFSAH